MSLIISNFLITARAIKVSSQRLLFKPAPKYLTVRGANFNIKSLKVSITGVFHAAGAYQGKEAQMIGIKEGDEFWGRHIVTSLHNGEKPNAYFGSGDITDVQDAISPPQAA